MGTVSQKAAEDATSVPSPDTNRASNRKWGKQVIELGFCLVPSLLPRAQQRIGLNPTQLAILIQLCDFWWDSERKPFPSKETLAQRLSLSERQVQRHIAALEKAGLIRRIERRSANGGKLSNTYDLSGLVKQLQKLEPEFREIEEAAKAARRAVSKRGYKPSQQPNAKGAKEIVDPLGF
jgi:DNA-binding transcriptional ArsR family regulator